MGDNDFGICPDMLNSLSNEIKDVVDLGTELCLVIGGGNIYRGVQSEKSGFDRVQGDHMGMLATIINGMALQSALESLDIETRLQTDRINLIGAWCAQRNGRGERPIGIINRHQFT